MPALTQEHSSPERRRSVRRRPPGDIVIANHRHGNDPGGAAGPDDPSLPTRWCLTRATIVSCRRHAAPMRNAQWPAEDRELRRAGSLGAEGAGSPAGGARPEAAHRGTSRRHAVAEQGGRSAGGGSRDGQARRGPSASPEGTPIGPNDDFLRCPPAGLFMRGPANDPDSPYGMETETMTRLPGSDEATGASIWWPRPAWRSRSPARRRRLLSRLDERADDLDS